MGKKIWLSMHPRNFSSDKIVRTAHVRTPIHFSGCEMAHLPARGQSILKWYLTSMLWSVNSCQRAYPLTSVT